MDDYGEYEPYENDLQTLSDNEAIEDGRLDAEAELSDRMEQEMAETLERIAVAELDVETLETRGWDGWDFYDLSVASLKAALEAAYLAGRAAGLEEA